MRRGLTISSGAALAVSAVAVVSGLMIVVQAVKSDKLNFDHP